MRYLSERVRATQLPPLVELGELARSVDDCISLGQGAPYYHPTGKHLEKLVHALDQPTLHRYTPDAGIIDLREGLADKLQTENKIDVASDQIVVTPGANQAFVNSLLTIVDPGDQIILLAPYYFNHLMTCTIANVEPVIVDLTEDFAVDKMSIQKAVTERTRAIVMVNPGNPTGRIHSKTDLDILKEICTDLNLLLISDETYEYFTYNNTSHRSIASDPNFGEQVITISSFSKSYGIPGWRLGYYTASQKIIKESIKVQDTIGICAPHPSQILATHLLTDRQNILPHFVSLMKTNHRLMSDLIEEIEWLTSFPGSGAYYLFPRQETGIPTKKLVKTLIKEQGIYIVPGGGFGKTWKNHVRLSFANVTEKGIHEAFSRLKSF